MSVSGKIVLFCWLSCSLGMLLGCGDSDPVVEIALHPTKPHILYIATNDYIYKTRNGGDVWENISSGMTHSRVIALAIDPLLSANVLAGTKGDGVFKSYNGGQNWAAKRAGIENVTISTVVHQLVFVPGSGQHIFAATSMGVYESEDGGETWIKRMDGMKEVLMVITLDLDPNQPQTLYAGTSGGVYKSVNGGKMWKKVNNGLVAPEVLKSSRALSVTRIKVDPHQSQTVYTATLTGLYKTTDGGGSWKKIGQRLPDHMLSDLVLDPTAANVLYLASREGIHKSIDAGQTWKAMNAGLSNLNIRALAISPLDSKTLYTGTNGSGLFRSRDGGESWEAVPLVVNPQAS